MLGCVALTGGTIMSPRIIIRSSTLILAQPFLPLSPTPISAPTFLALSKKNHMLSPLNTRTCPPGTLVPSKKTNGITISVALTAFCRITYSFLNCSRVCASFISADFVTAFGALPSLEFGPSFRRDSPASLFSADSGKGTGVLDFEIFGVAPTEANPSSSSFANESNPLPFFFLAFLGAGWGVTALYLTSQFCSIVFRAWRHLLTRRGVSKRQMSRQATV
jgi:hypothetical protein